MSVCDEILVLDFGKSIALGSPGEIRGNEKVTEAYLGTAA
jgi:branched-chain amino acid transport system ATP-binding protein